MDLHGGCLRRRTGRPSRRIGGIVPIPATTSRSRLDPRMRGNDQTPTPERLNMPTPLIETMPERTMNDEAKSELKAILAAYRARLVDSQEREAKLRIARASFV